MEWVRGSEIGSGVFNGDIGVVTDIDVYNKILSVRYEDKIADYDFSQLEELEHAKQRGAPILAELIGYGATCDAWHITSPDPEGTGDIRAMQMAIAHAGCRPEDIACISAHGTGTTANDKCETKAIRAVFGAHADKIAVSAVKSMIGHALGAAGAVAIVETTGVTLSPAPTSSTPT